MSINALPPPPEEKNTPRVRSLKDLVAMVTGLNGTESNTSDTSLAEGLSFPFLGLVGQGEMKLALLLAVINPAVGGVLLIGPRGTGKTTAVRSLADLLPMVERSTCHYGCLPEDIEIGGMDAVCPDCARKFGEGQPLTQTDRTRLIELPLNARLEDVIGGIDERAAIHERLRLKRGILSLADLNLLFVDEVNLLSNDIVDAILDAAAQGTYSVRRGAISAVYRARFTLIGSMNPEEGRLRPQMMDRFGLRIIVRGLSDPTERLEAYHRVAAYRSSPRGLLANFAVETRQARQEIEEARSRLTQVIVPDSLARIGIELIHEMKIDSLRAEITLFEAARALAAADDRLIVTLEDLHTAAPMALRMRHSAFMETFLQEQAQEDTQLESILGSYGGTKQKGEESDDHTHISA